MYRLIVITVPLVLLLGSVWSYPNGADEGACSTLAPYHNNGQTQPQQSQSPNGIKVDKSKWAANGTLTVSFTGAPVNGFILQAREKSSGNGVGKFEDTSLPTGAKAGPCTLDGVKISVTHTNPDSKSNLKFTWIPPSSGYTGVVYFQAAFAKDHDIFWSNVKSSDIDGPHDSGVSTSVNYALGIAMLLTAAAYNSW